MKHIKLWENFQTNEYKKLSVEEVSQLSLSITDGLITDEEINLSLTDEQKNIAYELINKLIIDGVGVTQEAPYHTELEEGLIEDISVRISDGLYGIGLLPEDDDDESDIDGEIQNMVRHNMFKAFDISNPDYNSDDDDDDNDSEGGIQDFNMFSND